MSPSAAHTVTHEDARLYGLPSPPFEEKKKVTGGEKNKGMVVAPSFTVLIIRKGEHGEMGGGLR